MESPTGFLATQWNFICFLPYFIGLLLLGTVKDDRDCRRRGSQLLLEGARRDAEERIVPRNVDVDDSDLEVKSDESGEDEDDNEDDTEALLAELEQIKRERAEEKR